VNGKQAHRMTIARRAVPLAMLFLMAHGLVVCALHRHGPQAKAESATGLRLFGDDESHSSNRTTPGPDSGCVSCRMQRTFASDVRTPSMALVLPSEPVRFEMRPPLSFRNDLWLAPSDRAPPLV